MSYRWRGLQMADERVKVCDFTGCPKRGKQVERYRIDLPGQVFQADLCKDHASPLREFIAVYPPHFLVKVRPGGRNNTGIRLTTLEAIEAGKRKE